VDEYESATLGTALELLASNAQSRLALSAAALAYVRREHDLERAADAYVAALEGAIAPDAVADVIPLHADRRPLLAADGRRTPAIAEP
jgi:hypothetical protein